MRNRRHSSPPRADHPATATGWLALVCAVAGCTGSASSAGPPPASPNPPPAVEPAKTTSQPVAADVTASVNGFTDAGVIKTAELKSVVKDGPQDFIQRVRVRPTFRKGQFAGWRILAYSGPGPIRAGDVVYRINRRHIERPEQFMDVWAGLQGRRDLLLEIIRNRQPLNLRYRIVD
jgi:type II secretory pathway component PulC